MTQTTLHIDSSARLDGSVTRQLTKDVVAAQTGTVIRRDLQHALPQIDGAWLGANWTAEEERDPVQRDLMALSDTLIDEIAQADHIVIGVALYNFGIPASLKAWIDLICRNGLTFEYGENGPKGLMTGKRATLVIATGGVPVDSPMDFATPYMRQVLGFIGITDIHVVAAEQVVARGDAAIADARAQIATLIAA